MKKTIFISVLVLLTILAISCEIETNYTSEGHYGKTIIHNEATSGRTITRIAIADGSSNLYNEKVSLPPGKSSDGYKLGLGLIYDIIINSYRVTITLDDNTTKSVTINAYEDIVNNLYYNGTDLVERK